MSKRKREEDEEHFKNVCPQHVTDRARDMLIERNAIFRCLYKLCYATVPSIGRRCLKDSHGILINCGDLRCEHYRDTYRNIESFKREHILKHHNQELETMKEVILQVYYY